METDDYLSQIIIKTLKKHNSGRTLTQLRRDIYEEISLSVLQSMKIAAEELRVDKLELRLKKLEENDAIEENIENKEIRLFSIK